MPELFDPKPRKWPKQGRSQATFDAILDATARILVERGFDALTTNGVAERAGASIGTLYEYFPDRETLVALVIDREARRILEALSASRASLGHMDADAALRVFLEAILDELEKRRALLEVVLTSVPFAARLPIAAEFPSRLVAIAALGGAERRSEFRLDGMPSAFFLMANMLRGAYLTLLLHPPEGLSRASILDDLAILVLRMLRGGK